MELIRISNHKLKIMLTPTDMRNFELNAATFGEDRAQMHRAFRLLLAEIRRQTDFEADDNSISVQYFPSREGGCEMFISQLSAPEVSPNDEPSEINEKPSRKKMHSESFSRECAYRFANLCTLLAVCNRLSALGYDGESYAFRDDVGQYYLFLSVRSESPFSIPDELSFLVEYGSIECCSHQKSYLSEHGQSVASKNAVHLLAALA